MRTGGINLSSSSLALSSPTVEPDWFRHVQLLILSVPSGVPRHHVHRDPRSRGPRYSMLGP